MTTLVAIILLMVLGSIRAPSRHRLRRPSDHPRIHLTGKNPARGRPKRSSRGQAARLS